MLDKVVLLIYKLKFTIALCMKRAYNLIKNGVIILLLCNCSTIKKEISASYSYKIAEYSFNNDKLNFISVSSYITYKDFLIEFILRTNIDDNKSIDASGEISSLKKSIKYDTIGVYLMMKNHQNYYEFDRYSINAAFIKSDSIKNKPSGFTLSIQHAEEKNKGIATLFNDKILKDSLEFNIPTYNVDTLFTDVNRKKIAFIKLMFFEKSINTPYSIMGVLYKNKYSLFGQVNQYFVNDNLNAINQGTISKLEEINRLDKKDIEICELLIKKSKSF